MIRHIDQQLMDGVASGAGVEAERPRLPLMSACGNQMPTGLCGACESRYAKLLIAMSSPPDSTNFVLANLSILVYNTPSFFMSCTVEYR